MAVDRSEHLKGLALFFEPRYRARYLKLIGGDRLDRLAKDPPHFRHLDARFAHKIPDGKQTSAQIAFALRDRGAPTQCLVLSEHSELRVTKIELDEALNRIVGFGYGTLVSCVPGRFGYFEGEEAKERYLLERSA